MNSKCIDVSEYQGFINWGKVKKSGIDYAIIRVGGRYAISGEIFSDDSALDNISNALANNIKIGIYFFTEAINEAEAVEEAQWTLNKIKKYRDKISLPIYIDTEYYPAGRHNNLTKTQRTNVIKAFCKTIQSAGYMAGLYASISWLYEKLDMSLLSGYSVWVAQYYTECEYKGYYDIWQYSSVGTVDGINGNVDMNYLYRDFQKEVEYSDDIKVKAVDVILGKYGNNAERVEKLGKDYGKTQDLVNEIARRLSNE